MPVKGLYNNGKNKYLLINIYNSQTDYTMYNLKNSDYNDILNLAHRCISCLKNGSTTESILLEILRLFRADEAVFLSPNGRYNGVNLEGSFALCRDRSFLTKYADRFWRYDPLYDIQFCSKPENLVFKTDDIIPYSQMVELDYYKSFLRPQNLLSELVIRLYSGGSTFGAISLQRYQEHSYFEMKDVFKASLLVPYLVNIFETAERILNIDEERVLLEQWMESCSEGIILLDSEFKPLYLNSKAKIFCLQLNGMDEEATQDISSVKIQVPQIIIQDCKTIKISYKESGAQQSHSNRITNTKYKNSYYIQYFPVFFPSPEPRMPRFIIFL